MSIKGQYMNVHGERILITELTIKRTVRALVSNCIACIREAESGDVFVNDVECYRKEKLADIRAYRQGAFIKGLWFWQKALYIQTGQSVPMLAKKGSVL